MRKNRIILADGAVGEAKPCHHHPAEDGDSGNDRQKEQRKEEGTDNGGPVLLPELFQKEGPPLSSR